MLRKEGGGRAWQGRRGGGGPRLKKEGGRGGGGRANEYFLLRAAVWKTRADKLRVDVCSCTPPESRYTHLAQISRMLNVFCLVAKY